MTPRDEPAGSRGKGLVAMRPRDGRPAELRAVTILIVDDEPDIRQSFQEHLEAAMPGVKVLTAATGPEALDLLRGDRIDLLVADYRMPGMDGLQFLRKARAQAPATPRILITAFPDLQLALAALEEAQVKRFLVKPIDPDHFLAVAAELLSLRRKNWQAHSRGTGRPAGDGPERADA